jgi:hypothetical protein
MLVKELIEILSKEDPEKKVFLTYDTFAVCYPLENIIEVYDTEKNDANYQRKDVGVPSLIVPYRLRRTINLSDTASCPIPTSQHL